MEAVDKLESMFQKAECDLDLIYKKLENDFAAQCEGIDLTEENPVKLLEHVSEIRKQYDALVADAKEIQKAQAEAMLYFKETLSKACQSLIKLQASTGQQFEKSDELAKVEELLDCHIAPVETPSAQDAESDTCEKGYDSSLKTTKKDNDSRVCHSNTEVIPDSSSAYNKRCASEEFIEITEEEFNSVSSMIRGRVKLSDVNSTYLILWRHFKENKQSDPLTRSDMHKMGLRVSGMTGECKLNVLRALKLLTISKKDEVKLL